MPENNQHLMNKLLPALAIACSLLIAACSTEQQRKAQAFMATPEGQSLLRGVERTAAAAASSAIQQYADTGEVKADQVAKDSLSSVSQQLRGLQATDNAADPAAIKQAVKHGSASRRVIKKVAPAVATAVADAVKKGAPADAANEAAARGLDKAAAKP
jgi:hypothetical protein